MDERRRDVRWKASYFFKDTDKQFEHDYFDVIDQNTNKSIGQLVDLTVNGMRIKSSQPLERGDKLSLRIDMPEEIRDNIYIEAQAKAAWCQRDEENGGYEIGFEITSITPPYTEIIEYLIHD